MSDFNYFYGNESELFQFVQVPKMLLKDARFKKLSSDAKILYALMLDRMGLSHKNGWKDDLNRVYIRYSVSSVIDDLSCSKPKAIKTIKELCAFGLVEQFVTNGNAARYYVKNFVSVMESKPVEKPVENTDRSKKLTGKENLPVPVKNFYPNNTEYNNTKERFIETAEKPLSEDEKTVDSCPIPSEVRADKRFDTKKIVKAAKNKNGKLYKGENLSGVVSEASRRFEKQSEVDTIGNAWSYYVQVVKSVADQWESIKKNEKKKKEQGKSTSSNWNRFHNFHQREYTHEEFLDFERQLIAKQW